MSLKAFHIVFMIVSMLLSLGFGVWAVRNYRADGDVSYLVCGLASFAFAGAMLVYGRWFMRKLRGVGYL